MCRPLYLLWIFTSVTTVSAAGSETADLHHPVTLRCSGTCADVVEWSVFRNVVARCDRTSCMSIKEGYEMSHDQYLQGDLSLRITAADYSSRGLYTCQCGDGDVCDVRLFIKAVETRRVLPPGEPIDVILPITDHVEVIFTPSDSLQPSDLKICSVDHETIRSSAEYKERVSRVNMVQIKDGKVSDSGNYTVRDTVNHEDIAVINVHVTGEAESQSHSRRPRSLPNPREPCTEIREDGGVPVSVMVLSVLLVLVVSGFVVLLVFYVRLKKEYQQLYENAKQNGDVLLENAGS